MNHNVLLNSKVEDNSYTEKSKKVSYVIVLLKLITKNDTVSHNISLVKCGRKKIFWIDNLRKTESVFTI